MRESHLEGAPTFWGLPFEFLVGDTGVDAGAGTLGQEPGIRVFQEGRVEGPQGTNTRLDLVYEALFFPVVEYAIFVRASLDRQPPIPLLAVQGDEFIGADIQVRGYPEPFLGIQEYSPFAIAAFAAFFALESLHVCTFQGKVTLSWCQVVWVLSIFSRFQSRRRMIFLSLSLIL